MKTIDEVIKEVVVENNLGWLHTKERAEYQFDEGRIPINSKDVHDIIKRLPIIVMGSNISVNITDIGILATNTIDLSVDKKNSIDYNNINPSFILSWEVDGYKKSPNFYGDQKDWIQTLSTKINELATGIHQATMIGPADTVEVHPCNEHFIKLLEYYNSSTKKISNKYSVIVNSDIEPDRIFVYLKNIPSNFNMEKINRTAGMIKIQYEDIFKTK